MSDDTEIYGRLDAAEYLSKQNGDDPKKNYHRLVAAARFNEGPPVKRIGNMLKFRTADLDVWLMERGK